MSAYRYKWQKSTYSQDGANCVNVAAAPDGTIRVRESDDPDVIVTTTPAALRELIARIKAGETAWARPRTGPCRRPA